MERLMVPAALLLVNDDMELLDLLQQRLVNDNYQVVIAGTARQTLRALDLHPPDLVIVSLLIHDVDSFQLVAQIKKGRNIPVIFLTPIHGIRTRAAEVHCCAEDYVVEPFECEELLDRIQRVLGQGSWLTGGESTATPDVTLTPRQLEILQLAATGATDNQIAMQLTISAQTVNWHMARIRTRLGVRSRTEAVVVALRRGLLPSE
jgi:DNA-binding NarL/FixJ family response regulator